MKNSFPSDSEIKSTARRRDLITSFSSKMTTKDFYMEKQMLLRLIKFHRHYNVIFIVDFNKIESESK